MPKRKQNILVVDDQPAFHEKLKIIFEDDYNIYSVFNDETVFPRLDAYPLDLILLDLNLDGNASNDPEMGLQLIQPLKAKKDIPIIIITADNRHDTIMRAMTLGADYYFKKENFEPAAWKDRIDDVIQKYKPILPAQSEPKKAVKKQITPPKKGDFFIAADPKTQQLKKRTQKAAQYPHMNVLILGETGVGKDVLARYLHHCSDRRKQPFVAVNMSELNDNTFESELFGHVKGAFTGAHQDKIGYFEAANKGVLFLDEVGELTIPMQIKLLRVLENRTIQRVGSTKSIELDIHLVTATNKDLKKAMQEGAFREDFYERINGLNMNLLPLRERKADIIPLINRFLGMKTICPSGSDFFNKTAEEVFESNALNKLLHYAWPRNIRQLRNVVGSAVINADLNLENRISIDSLPELPVPATTVSLSTLDGENTSSQNIALDKAKLELQTIEKALQEAGGRKAEAAKLIGRKNDQNLRTDINRIYDKFPELFVPAHYPMICEKYKKGNQ